MGTNLIGCAVTTSRPLPRFARGIYARLLASAGGAWIGLLWGAIYGAVSGGALAWLYARCSRSTNYGASDMGRCLGCGNSARLFCKFPAIPWALRLGAIAALQLIFATLWLVLRGTADESVHAKLLSYYVPGYTVTLQGALLGGLELFLLVYLSSALVGKTYNAVTRYRHEGEVK